MRGERARAAGVVSRPLGGQAVRWVAHVRSGELTGQGWPRLGGELRAQGFCGAGEAATPALRAAHPRPPTRPRPPALTAAVAEAIFESVLPRNAGDVLPQSAAGLLVSVADK